MNSIASTLVANAFILSLPHAQVPLIERADIHADGISDVEEMKLWRSSMLKALAAPARHAARARFMTSQVACPIKS